jgi:rhodanese-related sulfurtransferase
MQPVQNIAPQVYAAQSAHQPDMLNAPLLIDVREPWEYDIAHIIGARLLPLGQIYEWAHTLDKNASYVVMCHHGSRSAMACQVLQSLGFSRVVNLDGGIDAWSYVVDPSVARY